MSLVGCWKLKGNSTDYINGANGTDTNITYTNDYASFDGSSSKITFSDTNMPSGANVSTVLATIITGSSQGTEAPVIKWGNRGSAGAMRDLLLYTGKLNSFTQWGALAQGAFSYSANTKYFMGFSNSSSTSLQFYLNGNYDSTAKTISSIGTVLNAGGIGNDNPGTNYFKGRIKNIMVFNNVVPVQQIKTLYMQQSGMF